MGGVSSTVASGRTAGAGNPSLLPSSSSYRNLRVITTWSIIAIDHIAVLQYCTRIMIHVHVHYLRDVVVLCDGYRSALEGELVDRMAEDQTTLSLNLERTHTHTHTTQVR